MNTPGVVTFRISGKAMSVIEGSEIANDPVKYDGGSQGARDAYEALTHAHGSRRGKGWSYLVTTTLAGAEAVLEFCNDVAASYAYGDPETRADGRALAKAADSIKATVADIIKAALD